MSIIMNLYILLCFRLRTHVERSVSAFVEVFS